MKVLDLNKLYDVIILSTNFFCYYLLLFEVNKFSIVVELLLGEIPDKATFRNPQLKKSLIPYLQLTQAVRTGNLARFNEVLELFGEKFQKENTWTLIVR
jgi:26S proteasome regulatory subunit N3